MKNLIIRIKGILAGKKGFTLVECIMSIAIFAIMSAVVMGILAMCIQQRRINDEIVKDTNYQVHKIASGSIVSDGAAKGIVTPINGAEKTISFKKPNGADAGSIKGKYTVRYDKSSDDTNNDNVKYRIYAIEFTPN